MDVSSRQHSPEALAKLLQAINQKRLTTTSIKACEVLLAYAWGRPAVALEGVG